MVVFAFLWIFDSSTYFFAHCCWVLMVDTGICLMIVLGMPTPVKMGG